MDKYTRTKVEFLLDEAEYFKDKKELYLNIKEKISDKVGISILDIKICGSAYWGYRFRDCLEFQPGTSDLDVAIINPEIFCECMQQVRRVTRNFSNLTAFPARSGAVPIHQKFSDYALKKGIISIYDLPDIPLKRKLRDLSEEISKGFVDHFENINFRIYDLPHSFAIKQTAATEKFRKDV